MCLGLYAAAINWEEWAIIWRVFPCAKMVTMRTTGFEVAMGGGEKGREDVGKPVCMCWGVCVCERVSVREKEKGLPLILFK